MGGRGSGRPEGTTIRPDDMDAWPKQCKGCQRHTWPRDRMVNKPVPRPEWAKDRGDMIAALVDGTCTRCYTPSQKRGAAPTYSVAANGKPLPPKPASTTFHPSATLPKRHKMTPERLAMMQRHVRQLVEDRRRRGIPAEGIAPEDWSHGNGGLYSYEV